jgi:hypothetical protein
LKNLIYFSAGVGKTYEHFFKDTLTKNKNSSVSWYYSFPTLFEIPLSFLLGLVKLMNIFQDTITKIIKAA